MLRNDMPVSKILFAVVDVETTGLGEQDRVTEVACVQLRDFREVGQLASLVNPQQPIPPAATAISGIDDQMVADAPPFAQIADALDPLLVDAVFVAHNAPFDLRFLSREQKRCGRTPWQGPVLDTLRLARNTLPLPGYSLKELHKQLGLAPVPAHRALADVRATIALLEALLARHEPPIETLAELLAAQEPTPMLWEALTETDLSPEVTAALLAAGPTGELLELTYAGRSGVRRYLVVPRQMERNGPLIYLQAQLAESGGPRTFRADRILAAVARGPAGDGSS